MQHEVQTGLLDTAPVGSSSGKLKGEWGHGKTYATRREVETDVFKSVELFYNHRRKRQALGYLGPVAFGGRY